MAPLHPASPFPFKLTPAHPYRNPVSANDYCVFIGHVYEVSLKLAKVNNKDN